MLVSVTIIPNEKKLAVPLYHKESKEKNHYQLTLEFCDLAGISYDSDNAYKSLITMDCIIIITMGEDTIMTWLPNKISEEQHQKLIELKPYFTKFDYQEFSSWLDNNLYIYPSKDLSKQKVLEEFYKRLPDYYNLGITRTIKKKKYIKLFL